MTRTETAKRTEAPKWRTGVGRYHVCASYPIPSRPLREPRNVPPYGPKIEAGWDELLDGWEEDNAGDEDEDEGEGEDDIGLMFAMMMFTMMMVR